MESDHLKLEIMCWLRYGRRMPIVCTEFAGYSQWIADVFAVNETLAVEVEVKVSRGDLRREFDANGKLAKHLHYKAVPIPNTFYLAVPSDLVSEAVELVEKHAPKYGVVEVTETSNGYGRNSEVRRRAQKLHNNPPSHRLAWAAIQRMSSELVHLHQLQEQFSSQVRDMILDSKDKIVKLAARSAGCPDIENDQALLARAAELAFCVDRVTLEEFEELDEEQKQKWFEAARRFNEAAFVVKTPTGLGNWI